MMIKMNKKSNALKTILIVLLIGLMAFSMAACSKGSGSSSDGGATSSGDDADIETVLRNAQSKIDAAESMTYNMVEDMEMSIAGMEVPMLIDLDMEYIKDPMIAKITGKADMGGMGAYDMTMYMENEGDNVVIYTGMDFGDTDVMWIKQTEEINSAAVTEYNADQSLEVYLNSAGSFKNAGTEDVNGAQATRYDGIITGDAIGDVLKNSGMSEQIGTDLGEYSDLFDEIGDIPISFWVDTDQEMIVKWGIDMSSAMSNMMEKVMESEESSDELNISVGVTKAIMTLTVTGVDNVSEITISDEVKENATEMEY